MKYRLFLSLFIILALLITACTTGKVADDKVIYVVQVNPPGMLEQLRAGEIAGFVAWEPFASEAVNAGIGKYLLLSGDIWEEHPCCVLAVSEELERDEDAVRALVWAHIMATRFINDEHNAKAVFEYALSFAGKSEEVTRQALQNILFVEYPKRSEFEHYYVELTEAGLINKGPGNLGFIDSQDFFDNFLWEQAYREITAELTKNPAWQPPELPESTRIRLGHIAQDLHELAVYVADQEGYYSAVGLVPGRNLEVQQFSNGVAIMEAFKVREIDASYLGGAPATLKRLNDDIPIRIVAGGNDEGSALVVAANIAADSLADLENQTVAVPMIGTVQYFLFQQAAAEAGLKLRIK